MTRDMTRGALTPIIIRFTLPLVLGSMLQLTYNAIDSIILGRCVGAAALAAAGTVGPVMTLILMCVQGVTLGAGILVGNEFGAHHVQRLRRQVSTSMIAGSVFSLAAALLVIVLAVPILRTLQVDPKILPMARAYLRLIGAGLIFNYAYNFFANTLRAMGDSRSPLLFLALSALLNVFGDLFFVLVLHGGIVGCALSTVLCEALSAVLCWFYIKRRVPILDMGREWLVFDRRILGRTVRYGLVSAIQQSVVQLGIVGVQGLVNSLGAAATAAFAAANRIDDFALIPGRCIANAMTSVMAQNVGAGEQERVGRTFTIGMVIESGFGVLAGASLLLFAHPLMRLFTAEERVVELGAQYLQLIALMYILPSLTNGLQGYFRGVGDLKVTLISSLLNMGSRFLSCLFYVHFLHLGIRAVPWACFTGWVAMLLFEVPFLILFRRRARESADRAR